MGIVIRCWWECKLYNHLENSLAYSGKCPSSYASGYIILRNLYICAPGIMYKNIHSSIVHNGPQTGNKDRRLCKPGDEENGELAAWILMAF